jgi:uncharacterized protein YggT (Ycf19 family)
MDFVDFVLNLAGLLLWLNWRSERLDATHRAPVISLAHVVRKASRSPLRAWQVLGWLAALLFFRALLYWRFADTLPHTFKLDLIAIELPFSTSRFWLTLLYSLVSFLFMLGFFYLALLLFSLVNPRNASSPHRFVHVHLGFVDRLPGALKALLPGVLGFAFWMAAAHGLAACGIVSSPRSLAELWQRAVVIGLGVYVHWQWVLLAVLVLYFVNTYVYLGRHPIWEYLHATGRQLLMPLQPLPLRAGQLDFAPLVAAALISALAVLLESGWQMPAQWSWVPGAIRRGVLPWLYERAPF